MIVSPACTRRLHSLSKWSFISSMFRIGRFQAASTERSARCRSDQIQVLSGGLLMIGIGASCISVARRVSSDVWVGRRTLEFKLGFPEVADSLGAGSVWFGAFRQLDSCVMSRWAQFVALGLGQLGGLQSLRDIVGNLRAQPHKLYHLGGRAFVSRSSLARVNAQQPYTLYEALFGRLLARCLAASSGLRGMASGSTTSCSWWTRRPSTCAWRPSRGRRSGARKARSSCTSAWTRRDICRRSSA